MSENYYTTSDLALAATISLWLPIAGIDKNLPQKATFLFERNEDLDKLVESYWRKALKVEPQAFFNQLKSIKARLYSSD